MSPEINGNPPSVTKRKKNKKCSPQTPNDSSTDRLESSVPPITNCNYYTPTRSIPDVSSYYSFMSCSNGSEPVSLPVYPLGYPRYSCPPPNFDFIGEMSTPKRHGQTWHGARYDDEYLSLPVANMEDQTSNDSQRRFSDPGVPNESDSSSNSLDDRLVRKLVQQIDHLKENNRRLSREVMELRVEMNVLKQQFGSRHWDREYEPGMLAEVVREVRDAARVREDALLARVRHLIEEKQLNLNHMHVIAEKNKSNDRIGKLEEQMKVLSLNQRSEENSLTAIDDPVNSSRQVLELEREALELRRELQDTRAKKEESEQKFALLDKKLASLLRQNASTSDISEDGKTASIECLSTITSVSSASQSGTPRVTLSGPVTDL